MHWRQTGFSISLQARFSAWHNVWVELKLWDYTMEVTGAAWRVKVSFTVYITFYYREVFCLAGIWKDQISLEIFAAWQHVGVRRLWELEEDGGGIMSFESELFWQARKKLPAVKGGGGGGGIRHWTTLQFCAKKDSEQEVFKNLYWTEWGENQSMVSMCWGQLSCCACIWQLCSSTLLNSDTLLKRVLVQWASSQGVDLVTCVITLRVNSKWFMPPLISLELWLLVSIAVRWLLWYLWARWKLLTFFASSERQVIVLTEDGKGSISECAWTKFTVRNRKV